MKRTYYLAITAVILTVIVIFSMLNYSALLIFYVKYFDPHYINIFFITRHGKLIQNVSVSLFAFYPTPNGTVIKQIYQGFNLTYLSIPVSNLTWYAEEWLNTYNYTVSIPNGTHVIKKHIKYNASLIIPSLIGFASYYVVNQTNGTITIYTQPFSVRVSPRNITHGIGKTTFKAFLNPIVKRVKAKKGSSSSSSNAVSSQQSTTTTTIITTVPTQTVSYSGSFGVLYEITYNLTTYWVYPSNSSQFGPIPLALAYVTDPNVNDYGGSIEVNESAVSSSGISISFGVTLLSSVTFKIAGTSITLSSGSVSTSEEAHFGEIYPNFAEIYAWGQIAIVNYTEYLTAYTACGPAGPFNEGNVTMFFFTSLQAVGENGAYVPALYITNTMPSYGIQPFFTEELVYWGEATPYTNEILGPLEFDTSQGYIGGSVSLWPLIDYSLNVLDVPVPSWVTFVVSPNVVIVPFSSYKYDYIITFAMMPTSSNTYYVYYENTSVAYNIGGNNYKVPIFYIYINYTS